MIQISYFGIQVWCSDLIVDSMDRICLLCIAGYQTAVKAMIANIIAGRAMTLSKDDSHYEYTGKDMNYETRYYKLPSGLFQGLLLSILAIPSEYKNNRFIIVSDGIQSAKHLFFGNLDQKIEIPLHPNWMNWLWDQFIQNEWMYSLQTVIGNFNCFEAEIFEDQLKELITEGIAYQLPELVACFEKGDPNVFDGESQRFSG